MQHTAGCEREYDLNTAAQLKYGELPRLEKEIKENTVVIDKSKITNQNLFKEVTVKGNYQISLW